MAAAPSSTVQHVTEGPPAARLRVGRRAAVHDPAAGATIAASVFFSFFNCSQTSTCAECSPCSLQHTEQGWAWREQGAVSGRFAEGRCWSSD
mmetsp:Transcript_67272/g.112682  ORF Transcript_67272/g.112682 Transcript_67272/m.112682 type:complete len:92 (-) Transcript_67272:214-489(-)